MWLTPEYWDPDSCTQFCLLDPTVTFEFATEFCFLIHFDFIAYLIYFDFYLNSFLETSAFGSLIVFLPDLWISLLIGLRRRGVEIYSTYSTF